ncbi:MAG: ArsA family ATPase [Planctomycetota bacterium]
MRTILFTGKGGVGKTTVAAATALKTAELGHKTLVISTDPAHSLADAFRVQLGNSPVKISENIWGQEINVLEEIAINWKTIQDYIASVIKSRGIDEIIAEEMAVLPGLDELFALLEIYKANQTGKYDCLIVDCAPTGQTLRLTSLPDVARWWMQKIFPVERKIAKTLRAMKKTTIMTIPIPEDEVYASIQRFFNDIGELKELLTDPEKTSIRLVLNPEKIVVEETQRAYTYLNLYGYSVDCIIVNRILPDVVADSYFVNWHKTQDRELAKIETAFLPLPILKSDLMRSEILGSSSLAQLAKHIYGADDPMKIYYRGKPQRITREGKCYTLILKVPLVKKADLEILKNEDQITIKIGNYRREIILPSALALLDIKRAKLESNELKITFAKGD